MRGEVAALLKEMEEACRRPLFLGIQSGDNTNSVTDGNHGALTPTETASFGCAESETGSAYSIPRNSLGKRSRTEAGKPKSWDVILAEAADLLPYMTDREHGQFTKMAGLLLLGFLLPQSSGNEFFLLQNLSSKRLKKAHKDTPREKNPDKHISGVEAAGYVPEKPDMGDYLIQMDLEERLEACPHRYNPDEFGEFNTIVFEPLEAAFQSFLQHGLAPFLSRRPAHTTEVDLFYILAMAIHPQPSEQCIHATASKLEEKQSASWDRAKRLMSSLTPHSFNINYRHRLQMVRLVSDCLTLPPYNNKRGTLDAPLFEGVLPHLRASLYAFGMAAISPMDAHMAQCGMVSLAIQANIVDVVKEEWNRLSHRMVDDRTNYPHCLHCCSKTSECVPSQQSTILSGSNPSSFTGAFSLLSDVKAKNFCPHRARGDLLRDFLTRFSEARQFADNDFLQYALGSLTDAIEMQVDFWSKENAEENDENKGKSDDADATMKDDKEVPTSNMPPCVLASFLNAAKYLFYYLLPIKPEPKNGAGQKDEEKEESEESYRRDMLISCGIQLIHHWNPYIVKEASAMLVLAFSYAAEMWEDYVGAVFESVKIAIGIFKGQTLDDDSVVPFEGLISAFSQRSRTFATNIMQLLMKKIAATESQPLVLFRLVAAVATANPNVAEKIRGAFQKFVTEATDPMSKKYLLVSLLACRKARYFANEEDSEVNLMALVNESALGGWQMYQIARQALVSSNFSVAKSIYNDLANSAFSETSYIWLSALGKIGEGEATLSDHAAKALPDSTANLRVAISSLRSLPPLTQFQADGGVSIVFQVSFLEIRVSFLELLTSARQLTREMRLVGVGPKKYTRPHLHLNNIIKQFFGLGNQYRQLYRQYGLFVCQQTRSVLRTLHALCAFVGRSLQRVFQESVAEASNEKGGKVENALPVPSGDSSQPLISLMNQLQSMALKDMDHSVEAKVRATVMLEIMDGILKAPFPVPRSMTVTKSIPRADLQVMWDPREHGQADLQVRTDRSFALIVSGNIPAALFERAEIPFNTVLVWYTLSLREGSHKKGGKHSGDDVGQTRRTHQRLLCPPPIASSLPSSGSFFAKIVSQTALEEGIYDIELRLGCRDVRGGEWEIPIAAQPPGLSVKIRG